MAEPQHTLHPLPEKPHCNFKDLTGIYFGRLHVIGYAGKTRDGRTRWACNCQCGGTAVVAGKKLNNGHTQSCGCLLKEHARKNAAKSRTHGQTKTATYQAWRGMRDRCENPSNSSYKNYGGRGIKVCQRWLESFENFFADMGARPTAKHSLDRFPDQDGDYEPKNCRWATWTEQQRNKRNNSLLTYNGKTQCISAWAEEKGISPAVLYARICRYKWSPDEALTRPIESHRRK